MLNKATHGIVASAPSLPAELNLLRRELPPAKAAPGEATRALYERLGARDIEIMEQRLDPLVREVWQNTTGEDRMVAALSFCLYYGVEEVAEKVGLSAAIPPDEVHSMSRGPLAAGGSFYYADLVLEALRRTAAEPPQRALDFGCSSGRVVRVLKALLPDTEWHGCDPNADAIEWARANLPGIAFDVSPTNPPLPYEGGSFDLVYAISIWSHFGELPALRWLDEMRRVLRPGGLLVFTVHGQQSIAHFARSSSMKVDDLPRAASDLYSRGFHYRDWFADGSDHGVRQDDWGMAFLTTEWLLANATPEWSVLWFAPGRAERNQDALVLLRR
jgi:SAM-dependent methyltransferase